MSDSIRRLVDTNPALLKEFEDARHDAEAISKKFVRSSKQFKLAAVGDVNTYALFAETFTKLQSAKGSVGIIVPTGIASDDTTKQFFESLMQHKKLYSLIGFENEALGFQSLLLYHQMRYLEQLCLLNLGLKLGKSFCKQRISVHIPHSREFESFAGTRFSVLSIMPCIFKFL